MLDKLNFLMEIAFAEYGNKCTYTVMFNASTPIVYVNLSDKCIADFWFVNDEPMHTDYR
jgi:hypothetical protein